LRLQKIFKFFWRTATIALLLNYPGKTERMAQRQAGGGAERKSKAKVKR
jgi:hypothetical protein